MTLPRPVYEPGRKARGAPLWDAPAGSDGAEVLAALAALLEADNEAGVVPGWQDIPGLLVKARGFPEDTVRRAVQHVELMVALGRPFHRSAGATFWTAVSSGPNSSWKWFKLHDDVVPAATRSVFLEQLRRHVLGAPSSGETRPPSSTATSSPRTSPGRLDESRSVPPGSSPPPLARAVPKPDAWGWGDRDALRALADKLRKPDG